MFPTWIHILSVVTLATGFVCASVVLFDVWRHPPHMGIMAAVWPATALFGGPAVLWLYFRYGRLNTHAATHEAMGRGVEPPAKSATPFAVIVAKGALHCGSGCAIGDILAEWLAFLAPTVAVWFGWHSLFCDKMYAVWILDFVFAFLLGIVFQYLTIKPMRNLSPLEGLVAALKADTLSLTAWQVACTASWPSLSSTSSASFWATGRKSTRRSSGSSCRSRCSAALPRAIPSTYGSCAPA